MLVLWLHKMFPHETKGWIYWLTQLELGLTTFTIIISYCLIWHFIWSNGKYLKENGHDDLRKAISKREIQTTQTIFMVCLFFILFVTLPEFIWHSIWIHKYPVVELILQCLYYLQFSINFIFYAAKSKQYRQAYYYFLRRKVPLLTTFNSMYLLEQ